MYTNEVKYNSEDISLVKDADDMALVACLQDVTSPSYSQCINHLATWFDGSFLDLNVSKTKELCFRGRVAAGGAGSVFKPITMKGQEVEQVDHFKYLGTIIDNRLTEQCRLSL